MLRITRYCGRMGRGDDSRGVLWNSLVLLVFCASVLRLQFAARMMGAGGSEGDLRFGPL